MKALALNMSPRKGGNTRVALDALAADLREASIEVEVEELAAYRIEPCLGCRLCFDRGESACPRHDDLPSLAAKIAECDLLVAGSPVYVEDIAGSAKNAIDRMAFICHRPAFFGKRAFVVTTSGVGSSAHAEMSLRKALMLWGFQVGSGAMFAMDARSESEGFRLKYAKALPRIGKRLRALVRAPFSPSLLSMLVFGVQRISYQRIPEDKRDTIDYAYWSGKGWLAPGVAYAVPAKVGIFKRLAARALASITAAIVLK
jgi:multimeric flavodoxin WrbA